MKETGIVRKIDELGRIVIPIEIRRNMRVKNGDEMEMYISADGDIIIRKHSRIKNMSDTLAEYIEIATKFDIGHAFVTNLDNVVCYTGGANTQNIVGALLSKTLEHKIKERKTLTLNGDECIKLIVNDEIPYKSQIICSVISAGDVYGAVIFASTNKVFAKSDLVLAEYITEMFASKL